MIQPLHGQVVLEPYFKEHKRESGLIIPESIVRQDREMRGTVVAVASDVQGIDVGINVMFDKWGIDVTHEGKDYVIMDQDYIIGEIIDGN